MCGVFFNYNKDKITKSNKKKIKSKILKYLVKRGPDGLNEISSDNWYALHSLLSITNNKQTQPIVKNNLVMLYNGEIYNDWKKYSLKYGDSDFLTKHINKYGINGLRSIDGEFALIIFDQKKK